MSGYSGTPLPKKLGFKPGQTVWVVDPPDDFDATLGPLPSDVALVANTTVDNTPDADIAIVFALNRPEVEDGFEAAMARIPADGAIWVAWPKRSSGVPTELTEDVMRELFLPRGLVDVKVCAIDETWSGLKFVVRKENRADWAR